MRLLSAVLVLTACGGNSGTNVVVAPPCTPGGAGAALTLAVGGVAVFSAPDTLACMQIPAAATATGYLFIAANAYPAQAGPAPYNVAAALEGLALANGAEPAGPLGAMQGGLMSHQLVQLHLPGAASVQRNFAAARRYWQTAAAMQPAAGVASATVAALPVVGDSLTFRVPHSTNPCGSYDTVKAYVKAVGAHGILVQDVLAPANGFTASDFTAISSEFDTFTYPTDTSLFGPPTDLDTNKHVFILYTPRVNAMTPRNSGSYLAGFFFPGDLFPRSLCPQSNVGEIVYLLVPDPLGTFSDPRPTAFVRQVTRSVIAHEVEHLINLGVRIVESNTNPNITEESIWLDEALAHFAEEYTGRAEDGFSNFQKLTYANITANTADDTAFYRSNLIDLRFFLQRPDTASSIANTDAILADDGAAWALLHYTADQYASSNLAKFTLALVAGPDSGLPNLRLRSGAPFDSLLAGWMIALYADGLGISGLSPRYTFLSWNYRDAETGGTGIGYPLRVTPVTAGSSVSTTARPGSGNYFLESSSPTTPKEIFRVLGPGGTIVNFLGARLYALRVQ
ncbi:MAG TPA: hypothetical protein VEU55_06130 [Gemmatimonadales bacterium]|nr:hypothetical protein [Gemmatimonadales bacterium]